MGYKLALLGTVAVLVQTISCQYIGSPQNGPARSYGKGSIAPNLAGSYGTNRGINGLVGPNLSGSNVPGPNFPGPNFPGPNSAAGCAASTGGSFAVTSASPIPPTGVSVLSENLAIEGPLAVGGNLPFLGTVGLEGAMQTGGAGSVSYGCGSGSIGISSENAAGIAGPYSLAGANPVSALAGAPISAPVASTYGKAGLVGAAPIASPYGVAGPIGSGLGIAGPLGLAGSGIGGRLGGFNGYRK